MSTLWVVGDSTLSSFDDKYYYPRYGYGTKLGCYLNSKVQVNNLALSGRMGSVTPHASSSLFGLSLMGPTPSSHLYPETKFPPG